MAGKPRIAQLRHAMKYFGALMAVMYLVAGVALVWALWQPRAFSREYQLVLGVMLMGYGFFRGYRFYQKIMKPDDE